MIGADEQVRHLFTIFSDLLKGETPEKILEENREYIERCTPVDVSLLVDKLVSKSVPMEDIKNGVDLLMEILRERLKNYPYSPPAQETFLGCMLENNRILDEKLQTIQPLLKQLNDKPENTDARVDLICAIRELNKYRSYYEIKESILFPEIRKHISEHGCLSVMSSYHKEVNEKLELALTILQKEKVDIEKLNQLAGELLLIMYEMKFREERILYAIVQKSIAEPVLNSLYDESMEIGFPYFQPKFRNN